MSDNIAFQNFPGAAYPLDIYAYPAESTEDTEVLWHRHVTEPGAVSMPSNRALGRPVRIVMRFADGAESRS